MIDPLIPAGDGHAELSEEARRGLIPSYIATRGDLFDAEQRNISRALLRRRPPATNRILDDKYLRDLHRAMFGDVWGWAGKYRSHETNIGIEPSQIAAAVRLLVDDTRTRVEHATYGRDEIAVRFHHRLVQIHPFTNGNGRHGRIAADQLIRALGGERFGWGAGLSVETPQLRSTYIQALQRADDGEFEELLIFARA